MPPSKSKTPKQSSTTNVETGNSPRHGGMRFLSGLLGQRRSSKKLLATVPSNGHTSTDDESYLERSDSENSLQSSQSMTSLLGSSLLLRSQSENSKLYSSSSGMTQPNSSILSKKPSLISNFTETPEGKHDDFYAATSKSGVLIKQANHLKNWKKRFMVLRGQSLFYYVSGTSSEDAYPRGVISLAGVEINPVDSNRFKKPYCFEISHPKYRSLYLMAKNEVDLMQWMSSIMSASLPTSNGILSVNETKEELYNNPSLESVVAYQRVYYFRKKLAFCKPEYTGLSERSKFDLREKQSKVLHELHAYCDTYPLLLGDPHVYKEILHLCECFLFRPFPIIPPSDPNSIFFEETPEQDNAFSNTNSNNPFQLDSLSECSVEEQEWGFLSSSYDLLLRAIEYIDQLEKQVRKEFYTSRFIAQLVDLFKTPAYKERQILKTVLHRLYYKLTQRRSLIRKEISNTFYEYVYETSNYYGVTELLEILGSIINGFACPIKEEHIDLLKRALIPLHSTAAYISYHQQLAYCMIQFVSKDHTLFAPIVLGLLKYWPVGNSYKEIIFLVELEELFEYMLAESDLMPLNKRLAKRLGYCVGSVQQQVADRALACLNSPACIRVMNTYERIGQEMFDIMKPALKETMHTHWNLLTQQKAKTAYQTYYNMGYETEENGLDLQDEEPKHYEEQVASQVI